MKKKRVILLILIFLIGIILFNVIKTKINIFKAEKISENYLEENYKQDFVIDSSDYSNPLGEDSLTYSIFLHLANDPNITAHVLVSDDMEIIHEDYVEYKWRAELNEQFGSIYQDLFESPESYSYMVNVSFSSELYSKYNSSHTYQEIFKNNHAEISNIIFANVFLDKPSEMTKELDKIFTLIQQLKDQQLNRFSLFIEYYDSSFKQKLSDEDKQLDYNDFSKKHFRNRVNVLEFSYDSTDEESKQNLEKIKSPADLKQYLQKEVMN